MKYWPVYIIALVVAVLAVGLLYNERSGTRVIQLQGTRIHVTVAETHAQQEKGLGGRTGLASNEGMLFIFPTDGDYAFWMKDMQFSIDIVWLDSSGKVVYIAPSVSPDTYPEAFDPHMNARYVLELPAGYMAEHTITVGEIASL